MSEKVDSHRGIPRGLLKNFSTDNKVYIYDYKLDKNYVNNIDKVNVEKGYFDKDTEGVLSKYESDFSVVCDSIISVSKYESNQILKKNENTIIEFINIALFRNNENLNHIKKACLFDNYSSAIRYGIDRMRLQSFIGERLCIQCYKSEKTDMFTNSIGYGFVVLNKNNIMVIPCSPTTSILIVNENEAELLDKIDSMAINQAMIHTDVSLGYKKIIFAKLGDIDCYYDYLNKMLKAEEDYYKKYESEY